MKVNPKEKSQIIQIKNWILWNIVERLHPPAQVQKWLHVWFPFLKCLLYLCIPKNEKNEKKSKYDTLFQIRKCNYFNMGRLKNNATDEELEAQNTKRIERLS